jgi:hypothetical protein
MGGGLQSEGMEHSALPAMFMADLRGIIRE